MPKTKERERERSKAEAKPADRAERSEKAERSDKAKVKAAPRPESTAPVRAPVMRAIERPAKPGKPVEKYNGHKSPFTISDLSDWRDLLIQRRHEISSDIAGLEKDAMEAEDGHTTPNHIAERGSDADLQEVSLGIAGDEKDLIWQIDRALRKIDEGKPIPFGLCEYSKTPISKSRLQLIPWTPLSFEGATHMESNNLTLEDVLAEE